MKFLNLLIITPVLLPMLPNEMIIQVVAAVVGYLILHFPLEILIYYTENYKLPYSNLRALTKLTGLILNRPWLRSAKTKKGILCLLMLRLNCQVSLVRVAQITGHIKSANKMIAKYYSQMVF